MSNDVIERLESLSRSVDNIYRTVYKLNGELVGLRESIDFRLTTMENKIEDATNLHMVLKDEHEKIFLNLQKDVEKNKDFISKTKGVLKFSSYVLALVFAALGVYKFF